MTLLIEYAKSCLNVPYIYNGKNPVKGLDCSGFIEWVFMSIGFDPPGVNNAQMFHDYFLKPENGRQSVLGAGALCFYGKDGRISHIAMMINEHQIIEAGGGDESTTSVSEAAARGACVRIRKFGHRKDLIDVIMPLYPEWVT